tara:strand:- start:2080 stop:2262 length:183 start_codon:yes stop_codon:yes gene_type:complete
LTLVWAGQFDGCSPGFGDLPGVGITVIGVLCHHAVAELIVVLNILHLLVALSSAISSSLP